MKSPFRTLSHFALLIFALPLLSLSPFVTSAHADCPDNLLSNPGFEEGFYRGEEVGTSLSSWMANGWTPWSLVEGQQENREPKSAKGLIEGTRHGQHVAILGKVLFHYALYLLPGDIPDELRIAL